MIEKKIVNLRKDLLLVEQKDEICSVFAKICCVFALFAARSGEIC